MTFPSLPHGVVMQISLTPATFAGRMFIRTEDGYAAFPPGTYTPTRFRAVSFWPSIVPFSVEVNQLFCFCFSWNSRIFFMDLRMTPISSGSTMLYASSISSCVTSTVEASSTAWSNFSVYSKTAASFLVFTFSMISCTEASYVPYCVGLRFSIFSRIFSVVSFVSFTILIPVLLSDPELIW